MEIVRGTYEEYKDSLLPLFTKHYEEVGEPINLPFRLNEIYYKEMARLNCYLGLGLKDGDTWAGYLSIFIHPHPHHEGTQFASTDCFFINPKYRGKESLTMLKKLFTIAESILKDEYGVEYLQFTSSYNLDLTPIAERWGYSPAGTMSIKKL